MRIEGCDYCGRSLYLSEGDSCKGCGAPIMARAPAIVYESTILAPGDLRWIGTPGVNIPLNLSVLPPGAKLIDHYFEW
jgi:hypothetical protein